MRGFLLGMVGVTAAAGAAVLYRDKLPFKVPSLTAPSPPKLTPKEVDECRDRCEQQMIVAGSDEASMRACRKRCDGQSAAPAREAPSRITVAPARPAASRVAPR